MDESLSITVIPEEIIDEIFDLFDPRVRFIFRGIAKKYAAKYKLPEKGGCEPAQNIALAIESLWSLDASLDWCSRNNCIRAQEFLLRRAWVARSSTKITRIIHSFKDNTGWEYGVYISDSQFFADYILGNIHKFSETQRDCLFVVAIQHGLIDPVRYMISSGYIRSGPPLNLIIESKNIEMLDAVQPLWNSYSVEHINGLLASTTSICRADPKTRAMFIDYMVSEGYLDVYSIRGRPKKTYWETIRENNSRTITELIRLGYEDPKATSKC
jgi:hypothetical protein